MRPTLVQGWLLKWLERQGEPLAIDHPGGWAGWHALCQCREAGWLEDAPAQPGDLSLRRIRLTPAGRAALEQE